MKEPIKILAVGNSFSQDASTYVEDIANVGEVDLTIVNLYIGGCSLETHWNNARNDLSAYAYELNGTYTGRTVSIKEALESDDWTYVTMQQVSDQSGRPETYYPYIEELAKYIRCINHRTELVIHQTWAYETGYDRLSFYGGQAQMFAALKGAYNEAAARVGLLLQDKPLRIIPSGQAMQNARALPLFDDTKADSIRLCRDGYHASLTDGRYLLGAVWYEALTGENIENNQYKPDGVTGESQTLLKQCAHNAVVEYGWRAAGQIV